MGDSDAIEADRNKTTTLSDIGYTCIEIAHATYLISLSPKAFNNKRSDSCHWASRQGVVQYTQCQETSTKTLTKSRATCGNDLKRLITHNAQLKASCSKQKPFTKPSTKATGFNLHARASKPIVDPQDSNLCDPETQKPYKTLSTSQRV